MDNLTHALTGLMLSRAGLDRGEKGTAIMMMLAANAPDIDAYPFFYDSISYLEIHRGYTHALAMSPLVALLPLAIVKGLTRTRPTVHSWMICWIAVLSHILLDWTNVYGIRMLLPFSDRWLHLDITHVFDPILWGALLLAIAAPALSGLVGSEIASKKKAGPKRGWAFVALAAMLAYEGLRWDSHRKALDSMDAVLYDGEPATRLHAFPDSYDYLRWRGLAEGDQFYVDLPIDLGSNFDPGLGEIFYKAGEQTAIKTVQQTRTFRVFGWFNQVPHWRVTPEAEGERVELLDLRFGTPRAAGFAASALVTPDGRVTQERFGFGNPVTRP